MATYPRLRWVLALGVTGLGLVGVGSALAQTANFGNLTLSAASPAVTVNGVTAGFFSLANLAVRDHQGLICTGFADANPDHILTLQEPLAQLTLQVDSGGNDTTLLVQGPTPDQVRCGEDIDRRNPDAKIQDQNWPAGTYQIWVGAHNQGQRHNYVLTATP